jgi:hypothetical protein
VTKRAPADDAAAVEKALDEILSNAMDLGGAGEMRVRGHLDVVRKALARRVTVHARIAALEQDLAAQQKAADEAIAEWRKHHEEMKGALVTHGLLQRGETFVGAVERLAVELMAARRKLVDRINEGVDAATWKARYEAAEKQRTAEREAFEKKLSALELAVDVETPKVLRAVADGLRSLSTLADRA